MRAQNKDKELNHKHFIGVRLTDAELNLLDQGAACFSDQSLRICKEATFRKANLSSGGSSRRHE